MDTRAQHLRRLVDAMEAEACKIMPARRAWYTLRLNGATYADYIDARMTKHFQTVKNCMGVEIRLDEDPLAPDMVMVPKVEKR